MTDRELVEVEIDHDALDEMVEGILALFNSGKVAPEAAMTACMFALCSVLMSMTCRDCRRVSAKSIEEKLPQIMRDALANSSVMTCTPTQHNH